MKIKRLMSRKITVIDSSGQESTYGLSIAEVETDASDTIQKVKVTPYEKEEPNVEYVDSPLILRLGTTL